MLTDFHIHSIYSDGELIPAEIINRYKKRGFDKIAITDHIDHTNKEIINDLKEIKNTFEGIEVFIGAELTHVPPETIKSLSKELKRKGAELIIVHGESPVEPVPEGTNKEAVMDEKVDILAHPGFIKPKFIEKAKENNVFLELTARKGHCISNGYLSKFSKEIGAKMLVNTDSHSPNDFFSKKDPKKIAKGSGLNKKEVKEVTETNPKKLIKQL